MKAKRVKYNFLLEFPKSPFTIQQLMAENPGVQYITLYMRIKKGLKENILRECGTQQLDIHKRGRSQKLYLIQP